METSEIFPPDSTQNERYLEANKLNQSKDSQYSRPCRELGFMDPRSDYCPLIEGLISVVVFTSNKQTYLWPLLNPSDFAVTFTRFSTHSLVIYEQ